MAFFRAKDRVLEKSTTSGNGPYTLPGSGIDTSYNSWASTGISVGDTALAIVLEPGVAFWSGLVTYSAANQITLTTGYESKGTFGAGTKEIFMGLPASRAVYQNGNNAIDGNLTVGGAGSITGNLTVSGANGFFGPGGAGSGVCVVYLDGGSGAGGGGSFALRKNGGSADWFVGHDSEISGSGTSSDLRFHANGVGAALQLSVTTLDVTFGGKAKTPASTASKAGLNVPTGAAPTSPADGDIWNDGTDAKIRIGSVTRPLTNVAPTTQVLTSGTTYTTPSGVKWIEVTLVGGGGGGGGGQNAGAAGSGGNTTFSTFTAGGGTGGAIGACGAGGSASGGYSNRPGAPGTPGTPPGINFNAFGGCGGCSTLGGAGAASSGSSTAGAATTNSGSGGGGGGATNGTLTGSGGCGGGSGGTVVAIINAPSSSYTYAIGGGGGGASGGSSSTSAGGTGGGGASGVIVVVEHY